MDYHSMRAFADSWGLLFMVLFYLGAILYAFRPGGRQSADEAARIPLNEDEQR